MNVIERLKELIAEKGWSEYRLAKEADLPPTTIANIFHRNTIPSIPTLSSICDAFGITLSDFFSESEASFLTKEEKELLRSWSSLNRTQRTIVLDLLKNMN